MSCTPLNEANFQNLNEIKDLGTKFKRYYEVINEYLDIVLDKYNEFILLPILLEKTTECQTAISFKDDNNDLYVAIKTNSDELPDGYSLPDGYTDVATFLTDYESGLSYCDLNCQDEYDGVEFHTNMYQFYTTEELALIQSKYDNIVAFKESLATEIENDTTDIFDIETRLDVLVSSLLSSIE